MYSLQSSLLPHLLGADVGVAARAVPVARHGFGVQGGEQPEVLAHAVQDEARHPQVVPHVYALTRAHLELPLWDARDGDHDEEEVCCCLSGCISFFINLIHVKKIKKLNSSFNKFEKREMYF